MIFLFHTSSTALKILIFLFLLKQHLNQDRYKGPEIAAQAIASNFDSEFRKSARILDVAAGTGRLGAEVRHNQYEFSMDFVFVLVLIIGNHDKS